MAKSKKKKSTLDDIYKQFESTYGEGSIVDANRVSTKYIPTGILPIDLMIPHGGFPSGKLIMIKAPEGAGKTTLLLSILGNWQKNGFLSAKDITLYCDAEFRFDSVHANLCGADMDKSNVKLLHGLWAEANFEMAEALIRTGEAKIFMVDSIPALVPKKEVEDTMEDDHVAALPRKLGQALRKLIPVSYATDTTMIFTNQIRDKIGNIYGSNESIPGGRSLRHYSSLILDIRKIETLRRKKTVRNKVKDIVYGQKCKVKITKGLGGEGKECYINIYYGEGVHRGANLFDITTDYGILSRSGDTYYHNKNKLGSKRTTIDLLNSNQEVYDKLEKEVRKVHNEYYL